MSTTPQTLVEITHPTFGQAYQQGRQDYFQKPRILTDHDLVDHLETVFWFSDHLNLAVGIYPVLGEGHHQQTEANRAQFLHHEIGQYIGIISGCLIPRQPYEDELPDLQEKQASPTLQTPIKITHPQFRKGYQQGRQRYFQERYMLSDDVLLLCLEYAFEPSTYQDEDTEERDDALYYEIGQLVGEMCGCVLPRQLHEKRQQKLQKSFLWKVKQEHIIMGGYALARTIQQFWIVQDQLAHTLDADLFEEMITCGRDLENPLSVAEV